MRTKLMAISGELLRQALHLPDNATIARARESSHRYGDIDVVVECSEFPDVKEGELLRTVIGVITEHVKPCGCREYSWEWKG